MADSITVIDGIPTHDGWPMYSPKPVMTDPVVRDRLAKLIGRSWGTAYNVADALLTDPILGPRLLGQQGGDAGEALERAAKIVEGESYAGRYRTWPAIWPALPNGTRPNQAEEGDLARHCKALAVAIRALSATDPSPVQAGSAAPAANAALLAAVQAERDQAVAEVERLKCTLEIYATGGARTGAFARAALASSTSVGTGEASDIDPPACEACSGTGLFEGRATGSGHIRRCEVCSGSGQEAS